MGLSPEEFAARRAARRAAVLSDEARAEQEAKDREAIDALEVEHGYELDVSLSAQHPVAGFPIVLGVRTPSAIEYKRFFQKVNRTNAGPDARSAALEELGRTCLAYPSDKDARDALVAANPALFIQAGTTASRRADLRAEEEGKG